MIDRRPYPWGMNVQDYAHGWHSGVYHVKTQFMPPGFSHANLMREEAHEDRLYGLKLYINFKVANLLFPGQFPEAVAYSTNTRFPIRCGGDTVDIPVHYLFTKQVPVHDSHATYCNDMGNFSGGTKQLISCEHEECQRHDRYHENHEREAVNFAAELLSAGIDVPYNDRTDWCLHKETNGIVFFEILTLEPKFVRKYVFEHQDYISMRDVEKYLSALEKIK